MKNFYYLDKSGEVKGPFSSEEMRALNRSEQVSGATQVCEEGTENWIPYYQTAIGLPPRKQGPERIPKRKVQPKSKEWSPVTASSKNSSSINWSSIKENWSLVRGWWSLNGKNVRENVKNCGCGIFGIGGFIAVLAGYLDDNQREEQPRVHPIIEIESDMSSFVGKTVTVEGLISIDSYYNYEYDRSRDSHFCFEVRDKNYNTAHVYAYKSSNIGQSLRRELLDAGGSMKGRVSFTIDPEKLDDDQTSILADLKGYR